MQNSETNQEMAFKSADECLHEEYFCRFERIQLTAEVQIKFIVG
jgi:hypothetical protein